MGKTFTDQQIESLLAEYTKEYPDAVERMHFVMLHPYRENSASIARSAWEITMVAKRMKFFQHYVDNNPHDPQKYTNNPLLESKFKADVIAYVAAMLGPIGSYKVFE